MRFSDTAGKLKLRFPLHLALIAVIALPIAASPAKCAAQSLQQMQQRMRDEMERVREQQEQAREAERERERQQEQEQQAQREQEERQQQAEREREQQREQERQAENERQRQEQARLQEEQARQAREQAAREEQARQNERAQRERLITVQPRFQQHPEQPSAPRYLEPPLRPPFEPRPINPPVLIEPAPVVVVRPQPIASPAVSIVIPGAVTTLNANQANVVLQEILSTEAAEVQAITNGIDQIMLALIQGNSNADMARALQNRMNQPNLMQQTLNDQLQGFSAISQASANRSCSAACSNSPDVQRLTAQCNAGSQAACYQAAASLCQCSLSNGGCGYDANQLQACVQQNTQAANSLAGAPGTLNFSTSPGTGGASQSTTPGAAQNPGSNSSNCSSGSSACAAD